MKTETKSQSWVACDDQDLAAAFSTLGVPLKPEVQVRSDSGKETVLVFLGTTSATNPAIQTGKLMALLRSGELERADPEHPLLYALQGIKNRHALVHSIKTAQRIIAIRKKGSQRIALVKENITGDGLRIAERFLNGGRP